MTTTTQPVSFSADRLDDVLTLPEQPGRPGALSAVGTFGWRSLLKIKHVPEQLFDVTAFPIMITLLFTYLFGGAIAGSPGDYLQYLLPGILVQTVLLTTMYTGVALNTDISRGVFDRFRSLPIWRPAPLVGALLGDFVRYTVAAILVVVVGLILGFRPAGGVLGVVSAVALLMVFAYSLAWIWTLLGLRLKTPTSVMNLSLVVLSPLTFASNVFVDPATMPGWLEAVVNINPVTHLVTAVRSAMDGTLTLSEFTPVAITCVVLVAVFGPLTMRAYNSKE